MLPVEFGISGGKLESYLVPARVPKLDFFRLLLLQNMFHWYQFRDCVQQNRSQRGWFSSEEAVPVVIRVLVCFLLFVLMRAMGQYVTVSWLSKSCLIWVLVGFPWVIDELINAATILSRLLWLPYSWTFLVLGYYWAFCTAGWCYHHSASSSKWLSNGSDVYIVLEVNFYHNQLATWTSREFQCYWRRNQVVGAYSIMVQWEYVRPSVRTYILTLERGGRSGYLILLPLVLMLKM